jgi:hypothetical protein
MIIPGGTQNVYKWIIEWNSSIHRSIITGHAVALIPYGPFDQAVYVAQGAFTAYNGILSDLTYGLIGGVRISAHTILARISATHFGPGFAPLASRTTDTSFLERAYRIRRVGAGGTLHDKGRCRIGPANGRFIIPNTKARRVDTSRILTLPTFAVLSQASWATAGMQEVLYDRRTHNCRIIQTYSVSSYTGAVWQRAGYPQGHRGPPRH